MSFVYLVKLNLIHFARFYTRWKNGSSEVQRDLLSFAAAKILGGTETELLEHSELTSSQILGGFLYAALRASF